jgi:hypothetical protein
VRLICGSHRFYYFSESNCHVITCQMKTESN